MAAKNGTFVATFVRLPVDLHDEVKRVAAERDISMAQAIRAAVRDWVKNPRLVD